MQTLLAGSSPQVRWICSGVPSAEVESAGAPKPCDDAALRPKRPAPVTNVRRDMRSNADRSPAAPANFAVRLFATDTSIQSTIGSRSLTYCTARVVRAPHPDVIKLTRYQ